MGAWRGTIAGLAGGVIAAGAMSLAHKGVGGFIAGTSPPAPGGEVQASEDATVKVADGLTGWLVNRPLPEDRKPLAASIVHYAFGAGVGGFYGGVAEAWPRVTMLLGLPFGVGVWLGAHVIAVPALGLAAPPTRQPSSKEALELFLHLVYGAVTEGVRRLVRRAL